MGQLRALVSQDAPVGLDLRVARSSWRLQVGYRYYLQSGADFFQDKYTLDPAMYATRMPTQLDTASSNE